MTQAPTDDRAPELREALAAISPAMIAAAWNVVRDRYPRAPVLCPGPGFVEALAAGIAAAPTPDSQQPEGKDDA